MPLKLEGVVPDPPPVLADPPATAASADDDDAFSGAPPCKRLRPDRMRWWLFLSLRVISFCIHITAFILYQYASAS